MCGDAEDFVDGFKLAGVAMKLNLGSVARSRRGLGYGSNRISDV